MIPERLVPFFHGPTFFHLGTRDRSLQPWRATAHAARVHDDRATVTVLLGAESATRSLADLADNGRVALAGNQASHESYQLKGTFTESRPATAEELERIAAYHAGLVSVLSSEMPEEMARGLVDAWKTLPAIAITFRVEDVFVQTPGPGAGERVTA
jgi:hypothetical protein